jgi:hypothetical protein
VCVLKIRDDVSEEFSDNLNFIKIKTTFKNKLLAISKNSIKNIYLRDIKDFEKRYE